MYSQPFLVVVLASEYPFSMPRLVRSNLPTKSFRLMTSRDSIPKETYKPVNLVGMMRFIRENLPRVEQSSK